MSWQRAIAFVVLMVFLPVSVLAGTFVSHCIGLDGHSALEFVLPGAHHASADDPRLPVDAAPAIPDVLASVQIDDRAPCSDRTLVTTGRQTQRADLIPINTFLDVPAVLVALQRVYFPDASDAAAASTVVEPQSAKDPRLAERRTIVLLI